MKKFAIILACLVFAVLCFAGCSDNEFTFSEDAVSVKNGDTVLKLEDKTLVEVTKKGAVVSKYFDEGETVTHEGEFTVNGVKIGDDAQKFIDAFGVTKNNAMWETCLLKNVGDSEVIFNYPAFTGKTIDFSKFDDSFLTVGYKMDKDGKWITLGYKELKDICLMETDSTEKTLSQTICIISAGFNKEGKINMIQLDKGTIGHYTAEYKPAPNAFEWDKVIPEHYEENDDASIGIIGGADGPTSIIVSKVE